MLDPFFRVTHYTRTAFIACGTMLVLLGFGEIGSQIPAYVYGLHFAHTSLGIVFGVVGMICGVLAITTGRKSNKRMLAAVLVMGFITVMSSLGCTVSTIVFGVIDNDANYNDYDRETYEAASNICLTQTILFALQGITALILVGFSSVTLYYGDKHRRHAGMFISSIPTAYAPQPNFTQTIPKRRYPGYHVQFHIQPPLPHTCTDTDQDFSVHQNEINSQMECTRSHEQYETPH